MVVPSQIERCAATMVLAGLKPAAETSYALLSGGHTELFAGIWQNPLVLQADVVLARVAEFCEGLAKIVQPANLLLDVACGRVHAGFTALSAAQWKEIGALASRCLGHAFLVKATDVFRGEVDLFGSPRKEWKLSHQIKQALDPERIFAPGILPGRV
jgi:FAD/FMN-containing dehydrogenase